MKKKKKKEEAAPLEKKVDTMIRLIAIGITYGKSLSDQVMMLSNAGFKPKEIAGFLRKTPNAIRITLTRVRKGKRTKK